MRNIEAVIAMMPVLAPSDNPSRVLMGAADVPGIVVDEFE
jgi:hypothetical protein